MMNRHKSPRTDRTRGHLRESHCTREQLEALEDGELGASQEKRLLRHLETCVECRSARTEIELELAETRSALEHYPRIGAPPGFDAGVWAAIEARRQVPPTFAEKLGGLVLSPVPRLAYSAAAGLVAALLLGHVASWQPTLETYTDATPPVIVAPPSL